MSVDEMARRNAAKASAKAQKALDRLVTLDEQIRALTAAVDALREACRPHVGSPDWPKVR